MEKWVDIAGYKGLYQISSCGNVRSFVSARGKRKIPKLLKPEVLKKGYLRVPLCKDYSKERYMVHRLVAMAFIPNPDNLPYINHKDENKSNNNVDNLEWCTGEYNTNYGTRNLRTGLSRRKPVLVIDKNSGNIVLEHSSMTDAALYWGVKIDQIIYFCRTKRNPRSELLKKYKFVIKNEKDVCSRSKIQRKRY